MLNAVAAEPAIAPVDRRQRRRQESIEEILDIAVEIMTEHGVGGLSLGEVARRMGIRPPSLYGYFPSKDALYDVLFARAAREIQQVVNDATTRQLAGLRPGRSLEDVLLEAATVFVRWTMEHPAYAQLLYWRPVPGFEPSPESFAPAVELYETSKQRFTELQRRGLIRPDAAIDDVQHDWVVILTGVVTRQLANTPHETFHQARLTITLSGLIAMFARHYAAVASTSSRGSRNAGKR
jgi:AcrR family transcriptional regulator